MVSMRNCRCWSWADLSPQGLGHIRTVTGDSARDTLALSRANVGIASEVLPCGARCLHCRPRHRYTDPVSTSSVCATTRSTLAPSPSVSWSVGLCAQVPLPPLNHDSLCRSCAAPQNPRFGRDLPLRRRLDLYSPRFST